MVRRNSAVVQFVQEVPSLDSSWRAIVLFGRNVACYKFALAGALLEVASESEREMLTLEELALPFATRIAKHLENHDRQTTARQSGFLDACRTFNLGDLDIEGLRARTVRDGFGDVIDAFHNIDSGQVPDRFFNDERRTNGGIRLTDNLREMLAQGHGPSLREEVESRWNLVENAWELGIAKRLMVVQFEPVSDLLYIPGSEKRRRTDITSVRPTLDGYQKGHCFYCFGPIDIESKSATPCEVDHVFAWSVGDSTAGAPIDGIWNLVLACPSCNNWHSKSNRPPHVKYVERLHKRNEFLIASEPPLRPTLIAQTGPNEEKRAQTLRNALSEVTVNGARQPWEAPNELPPVF